MNIFTGTSDLFDTYGDQLETCATQLRSYGTHTRFTGKIVTLRSFEDNLLLKDLIREPGEGRVIVVDSGASLRVAMLGDNMARLAADNDWAGVVVNGAVRDVTALADLPIGIRAPGSNPRRSRKDGVGHVGETLSFGGAVFTPGRQLVADEDGVVVLPA